MALVIKVPKHEAESTIKKVAPYIDKKYKITSDKEWVYIPVVKELPGYEILEKELPPRRPPLSLEDLLRGFLTPSELSMAVKSFDIIGDVAIIRLPLELKDKWNEIGKAIMRVHKNVRAVAVETGPYSGEYRVPELTIVAGKGPLETLYKEHGVRMYVDPSKVYFSVRHSYERIRIARKISENEIVGVFFAGVGPYPLVFAKHSPAKKIFAIELNPIAWKFMVKNTEMNKFTHKIIPVRGDVKDVVPRMFPSMAHRIVMPLPKDAHHFLDEAFLSLRPEGGTLHYYTFVPSDDPEEKLDLIKEKAEEHEYELVDFQWRHVADYSPKIWKVVYDMVFKRK